MAMTDGTMNSTDPKEIIARSPMSRLQIISVCVCVLLNAIDGFDVLAISFAAPGIASAWGVDRAELGLVLSMELIGMAIGSVLLGYMADRLGRRPIILGCLILMSSGMYLASITNSVLNLSVVRLLTGLGIGGMLATTNAIVAEYSNVKRRHMSVTLMAAGYPLGGIIGGIVVSILLAHFDWRSVFIFGSVITAMVVPLVWLLLPESVEYLNQKRPRHALERINGILVRMEHSVLTSLPELTERQSRNGIAELMSPALLHTTVLLTLAYFSHIMTFYFVLKWIPKIVVDMGFAAAAASSVLVWANIGGITGSLVLSLLTQKFSVRSLVVGALLLAFVTVTVFGFSPADLQKLSVFAAIAGFFTNSAVVGLYAIMAQSFPARVRAGGTGLVIGVGRGGAALGPVVAGFLMAAGNPFSWVAFLIATGSLVAAAALLVELYWKTSAELEKRG